MIKSVYIHIPFCRRKCHYCSFISFSRLNLKDDYINALIKEIKERYKGELITTLYIGGGTPSLLSIDDIENIIDLFSFEKDAEITCEANPEKLSFQWLKELKQIGINRLSLGVQTFNDNLLKKIGRLHTSEDVFFSYKNARKAGFNNINMDLIYGLPEQTMNNFISDVSAVCKLEIEHISSYGLKIEKNSYFYKERPLNIPDDDIQADMYLKMCDITEKYDYKHYEISNFAKEKFYSRHNLNYWNANQYYGFGCASSGYENDIRYSHTQSLDKYIKNPLELKIQEKLTNQSKLEEMIFLGFRKTNGINIEEINNNFGINFEQKYKSILNKYSDYFVKTEKGYSLTKEGLLISNFILSEFIS
ncbi:radical SAM family heme chaperone HemW [bacterium]|nr:radical SAM family heme chaperone HemW [bacterium]